MVGYPLAKIMIKEKTYIFKIKKNKGIFGMFYLKLNNHTIAKSGNKESLEAFIDGFKLGLEERIKWLKEDIEKLFEGGYIEGKKDLSCKKVLKKIDEAFEVRL